MTLDIKQIHLTWIIKMHSQSVRMELASTWHPKNMSQSSVMCYVWRKIFACAVIFIVWTSMPLPRAITLHTLTFGLLTFSIQPTTIHSMWCLYLCSNWLVSLTCCRNGKNYNCAYFYVNQIIRAAKGMVLLINMYRIYFMNVLNVLCICVCIVWTKKSNFSVNSTSSYDRPAEVKLQKLLKELRISATIHQIPEWSQNEEFAENGSILRFFTENTENDETGISDEDINRSKLYMQG